MLEDESRAGERTPKCALPGCETSVPRSLDGRPPRRYCSPEHHARDRARAAASTAVEDSVPPLSSTDAGPRAASVEQASLSLSDSGVVHRLRPRPARRLVAVAGAAAVLATCGLFVIHERVDSFNSDHVPRPVAPASWESQARVALSSIDRQLATIATTEAVWNTQIAQLYAGTPEQVRAMLTRKTMLEQQRAALQSQLATLNQLAEARAAIADLDRQIAQVTATLNSLPPAGRLSPDQLYVRDALTARRDLLLQERAARQADIDRLQQGVVAAQLSPVPDPVDQTTPLTQQVLDLRNHPPAPAPPSPQPAPPSTNSGARRDQTILASEDVPRSAQAPASAGLRPPSGVVEAVTKPVRAVNRQATPTHANSSSSSRSDTAGTGKASSRNPSPPPERDSSDASRSDSDSDAPAPRSASASRRSSGSSSGGTSSGSSAQQAYDYAMNTPQGRMAGFIAGASGAPVG
ncbi:hypothetical protein Psed_6909 (plasmid) [Pseudonocardia dioxanivorans CB1190]|uniref:Uncharacterized protein n=1 Tax=Pseudonocardia dioxanivorans (strain ATCC 55486 / DSM 44775 / JCM 13855 / CB1190) TaxID=675635 RepID=F2L704_PSEUX|nr:hypothetical protein Psed_6909 [Pseudonocardia dioxanivorans CB1190]